MRLLDIGSHVATPRVPISQSESEEDLEKELRKVKRTEFEKEHAEEVEKWIDQITEMLPELKNFILPSGGMAAAHLHVGKYISSYHFDLARTICRNAERSMVSLLASCSIDDSVFIYINRLSDYLFSLARLCA